MGRELTIAPSSYAILHLMHGPDSYRDIMTQHLAQHLVNVSDGTLTLYRWRGDRREP